MAISKGNGITLSFFVPLVLLVHSKDPHGVARLRMTYRVGGETEISPRAIAWSK